jgi:tetratricopeptide (TPR) repeat protein
VIARVLIVLLACISLVPPSQCGKDEPTESVAAILQQAVVHVEQGNTYFDEGLYDKALEEYDIALELDPGLADAYLGIGRVYHFDQGKYSRAEVNYSQALELDPGYTDAYFYRGLSWEANGAYDRAIEDFTRAIELDPGLVMAYHLRAWCYAQDAQWSRSSQLYLYQLYESDPGIAQAYRGDGWTYVRETQWEHFVIPYLAGEIGYNSSADAQGSPPGNDVPRQGKYPLIPYVQIEPVSGPVGTKLFIYGWGFRTGEDGMTVTWDDEIILCNVVAEVDGSLIIDGSKRLDGTTRETIYVPESTQGIHIIGVYGSSFTPIGVVNDTEFEIIPNIRSVPEPDIKGTKVNITGTGFASNEVVSLSIESMVSDEDTTATADELGSFEAAIIVPTLKETQYGVIASGNRGNSAEAGFTISLARPVPTGEDPDIATLYCNRGYAHFRKAQWALAISDLESAYEADPALDRCAWNMEWALSKQQEWDLVRADYEAAIAVMTGSPASPAQGMGELEDELELALADYREAVELSEDPALNRKISESLAFVEEWGESVRD